MFKIKFDSSLFKKISKPKPWVVYAIIIGLILLLLPTVFYFYYRDKIFPGVYIASTYVGGKSVNETKTLLSNSITVPETISIQAKNKIFDLSLKEIEVAYELDKTVENAFKLYRTGNLSERATGQVLSHFNKQSIPLEVSL